MIASRTWIALLSLVLTLPISAARIKNSNSIHEEDWTFHSFVPLGMMPVKLEPSRTDVSLMATAESPLFEGWRRVGTRTRQSLIDASGAPVRYFPDIVSFRVSAGTRGDRLIWSADRPDPVAAKVAPAEWLKSLSFRLKVFRGLEARELEPVTVRNLGVPLDVPYDERIYVVTFELKDVLATDRIMLEVFGPDGKRVGRFHLELL